MNVVTRLPLTRLTTEHGEAKRIGWVGAAAIRAMLRQGVVRFVIADVDLELRWHPTGVCFDVWKKEVQPHLAEPDQRIYLEDFADEYAYLASHWDDGGTPIIVLWKMH